MKPDPHPASRAPVPPEGVPVPTFVPPRQRAKTSPARAAVLVLLGLLGAGVVLAAGAVALALI
jgi:hypothetical protein